MARVPGYSHPVVVSLGPAGGVFTVFTLTGEEGGCAVLCSAGWGEMSCELYSVCSVVISELMCLCNVYTILILSLLTSGLII